jgi:acylphosphatase
MRLCNVNGNLTVFSQHKGFENYIKAKADELGITGTIQRYHHNDVVIEYEGTEIQVKNYSDFLYDCQRQDMINYFTNVENQVVLIRFFREFKIMPDFSRTEQRSLFR